MNLSRLTVPKAATFTVLLPFFAAMATTPGAHAEDGCGVGMSYNYSTQQCEPWAPVGVNSLYDPGIPVPIPNFNVVPDINVGLPGVNLPRVDPDLRGIDAPIRAPIVDVPHNIPIHGGRR